MTGDQAAIEAVVDQCFTNNTMDGTYPATTATSTMDCLVLGATSLDIELSEVEVFLTAVLALMLSTDPGAVAPGGEALTICTLTPVAVSFPVQ